jgi:hypothetical protein
VLNPTGEVWYTRYTTGGISFVVHHVQFSDIRREIEIIREDAVQPSTMLLCFQVMVKVDRVE